MGLFNYKIGVTFLSLAYVVESQYNTEKHICGGWFHSVPGSIEFVYNGTNLNEPHVCAWTVSGSSPSQYARYDITIKRHSNINVGCDPSGKVGVSHFNEWAQQVTSTETWTCGGTQTWRAVPGTLFVVVFTTTNARNNTGFELEWQPSGELLSRGGVRTMQYTWGKHSVEPLPYYAAYFFTEEVSFHLFPKGNGTGAYEMELQFSQIRIDQCNPDRNDCTQQRNSSVLICEIHEDGILNVIESIHEDRNSTGPFSSAWGMGILVWGGNFWGSGGRFQMNYESVRPGLMASQSQHETVIH